MTVHFTHRELQVIRTVLERYYNVCARMEDRVELLCIIGNITSTGVHAIPDAFPQRDSGAPSQAPSNGTTQPHGDDATQRDSGTAPQRDNDAGPQRDSGTAGQRDSGTETQETAIQVRDMIAEFLTDEYGESVITGLYEYDGGALTEIQVAFPSGKRMEISVE